MHLVIYHLFLQTGKTAKHAESCMMSYVHQHVWMSYCSLALRMANLLYQNTTAVNTRTSGITACTTGAATTAELGHHLCQDGSCCLDPDYIRMATQLFNSSIQLAVKCLSQVTVADDVGE